MTTKKTTDSSRDRIVDAALELFAENGYDRTPISAIAKRADVAQGLLYRYYSGKEALLREIIQTRFADMQHTVDIDPYAELPEKLEVYLTNVVKSIKENTRFWSLFYGMRGQPILEQVLGQEYKEIQNQIITSLATFFDPRGAHSDHTEAIVLFSIVDGICMNYIVSNTDDYPIEEIIECIISKYR
ncbi:MAG: TetR/AcrR family transcriptional regulator [Ignavibacteria bacterium]|nr:TetR/AcrR family transcriptional regulator [Ignavibacteria bacterium]